MSRVPSFYTSRSIVNLSGLSVSDPAPVADGSSYDEMLANVLAQQQQGGGRASSSSTRQLHQQAAANFADVFNRSPETVGGTDLGGAKVEEDSKKKDTQVISSSHIAHAHQRNKSEDNLLSANMTNSNATTPTRQRSSSGTFEDAALSPKLVEKTTNMANFYYRQAAQSPPDKSTPNNTI